MLNPLTLDVSQDGSPWVLYDKAGTSDGLDVSMDGSPWFGYRQAFIFISEFTGGFNESRGGL